MLEQHIQQHYPKVVAASLLFLYKDKYLTWHSLKHLLMKLPMIEDKLMTNAKALEDSLSTNYQNMLSLPSSGLSLREVLEKTDGVVNNEIDQNHVSGIIYNNNEHHLNNLAAVFRKFLKTNPLHPDLFPEVREMEIDIIQMTSHLFIGDENVCGNVTSGGTESILLAVYTYREWAKKTHGITRPNIVAFHSVHPAFDKACHYFGITLTKVSSLLMMKLSINWNTICVVGSAPTYAYGIIDPIQDMAEHCEFRGVPMHVDCCMGGFILPFLDENPVHFGLSGITSISADSHKYGNCAKGSSVLLFRSWNYKQHQHFMKTDWEGGIYATPTLLGSKSGALIATTWASMLLTGHTKYAAIARSIQSQIKKIRQAFENHPQLEIIGTPQLNIIAFKGVDIYKVAHHMKKWNLSILTNPAAFHFCVTSVHTDAIIEEFIADLTQAADLAAKNPSLELSGTLAVYGSATKLENSFFTRDVVNQYIGLLSSKRMFNFT
jgi:glutamate/tyrosine decarboxylase-like PLP-dependent enzyme